MFTIGPLQKKHMLTSGQESLQMCQGFRILAPGRALSGAYQCVYPLRNGLPLNAYYLEHLLCYNYKEKLEQSNSRPKATVSW